MVYLPYISSHRKMLDKVLKYVKVHGEHEIIHNVASPTPTTTKWDMRIIL